MPTAANSILYRTLHVAFFFNVTMASSKEGSSAGSSKENDGLSSSSDDEDVQVRNFPVASQLVALALML